MEKENKDRYHLAQFEEITFRSCCLASEKTKKNVLKKIKNCILEQRQIFYLCIEF